MPDLTYAQIAKATAALAKDITRSGDAIHVHATHVSIEAEDTARLAEAIGALNVDSATVGATNDLARLLGDVATAAGRYAAASEVTGRAAQIVHQQNRDSHAGIGEAAARSSVGSDIYNLNPTWITPQ